MKQKLICCNYKEAEIINVVSQLFFESLDLEAHPVHSCPTIYLSIGIATPPE